MIYHLCHGFIKNVLYKVVTRLLYIVKSGSFQIGAYTLRMLYLFKRHSMLPFPIRLASPIISYIHRSKYQTDTFC